MFEIDREIKRSHFGGYLAAVATYQLLTYSSELVLTDRKREKVVNEMTSLMSKQSNDIFG